MKIGNEKERLLAGIDCSGEIPGVCYQTEQMKEPQRLPLDFERQAGHAAWFRRILSALKRYGRKESIRAAVILPDMSEEGIHQYIKDACEAGFREEQLQVMSRQESVSHFIMHQTNDIWQHQVWLLEFGTEEIQATCVQVNKRTTPMVVQVEEPECWCVGKLSEGGRDERLLRFIKEEFSKKKVSAVFLTGTDLNVKDYEKSREMLCHRRRVFVGEQIPARGACMAAGDQEEKRPYLFLGEQTLLFNVGIRSSQGEKECVHTLIDAGCSWYEAKGSCEVILLTEPLLEFCFQSMLGKEPIQAGMYLTDLPKRPERTSRVLVKAYFSAPMQCEVEVADLGFGEMYPSSDLCWRESFKLEEQKEEKDGVGFHLQV